MSPRVKENWVCRGILSACECFSCENKVRYRLRGDRVYVLCKNPCSFKPITGEARPPLRELPDIEKAPGPLETRARRRRGTGFSI